MSNTNVTLNRQQKAVIARAPDISSEELEEISIKTSIHKETSFRDGFSLIFKGNITTLVKMKLTPTSFKIVIYLLSILGYGDILINLSQSEIAEEPGLCRSDVSRTFRELSEKKILLRDAEHNHVYLNSNLCIKGIPRRFNEEQMNKFKKSRIDTKDFDDAFSLYHSGKKVKPNKKPVTLFPTGDVPF